MGAQTRSSERGDDAAGRRSAAFIYGAVGITALLYVLPFGALLGRPLVWFSTMVHELGHGIAALCVGGTFSSFVMYADGSGLAQVAVSGAQAQAIVSAGGLVGPAVKGFEAGIRGRRGVAHPATSRRDENHGGLDRRSQGRGLGGRARLLRP